MDRAVKNIQYLFVIKEALEDMLSAISSRGCVKEQALLPSWYDVQYRYSLDMASQLVALESLRQKYTEEINALSEKHVAGLASCQDDTCALADLAKQVYRGGPDAP